MKLAIDQTEALYQLIKSSSLKTAINGGIYKDWRPMNSNKEDIVVNSLTLSGNESCIQPGIANANIHVPSLITPDGLMPNHIRFKVLSELAKSIVEAYRNDYTMYVESSDLIKEPTQEVWFLNLRFRFIFHNTQ